MLIKNLTLLTATLILSQFASALNTGGTIDVANDPCISEEIYAAKKAAAQVLNVDDDDIELVVNNRPTRISPLSEHSHRIPLRFDNGRANAELVVRVDATRSCEIIGEARVRVISASAP